MRVWLLALAFVVVVSGCSGDGNDDPIASDTSAPDLHAIQEEIAEMSGGYSHSVGSGAGTGVIDVFLRADGEHIAAEIFELYGDLVDITVGALSYPDRTRAGGFPCDLSLPSPPADGEGLVATLRLDATEMTAGAEFGGRATITNEGEGVVEFEAGTPLIAFVFLPGGSEVIGVQTGNIAGLALQADLEPGESIDIDVIGGTASCDPDLGYALPPGEYEVRAALEHYERPNGQFELWGMVTEAAALRVAR